MDKIILRNDANLRSWMHRDRAKESINLTCTSTDVRISYDLPIT